MGYLFVAMQRCVWLTYRLVGLVCLMMALGLAAVVMQLEQAFVAPSDKVADLLSCLALFPGALLLVPSTTPVWIKTVDDSVSAALAIAALVLLSMGVAVAVPLLAPFAPQIPLSPATLLSALNVVTVFGVISAGLAGLLAPRRVRRRVPLLDRNPTAPVDARMLRKART